MFLMNKMYFKENLKRKDLGEEKHIYSERNRVIPGTTADIADINSA